EYPIASCITMRPRRATRTTEPSDSPFSISFSMELRSTANLVSSMPTSAGDASVLVIAFSRSHWRIMQVVWRLLPLPELGEALGCSRQSCALLKGGGHERG